MMMYANWLDNCFLLDIVIIIQFIENEVFDYLFEINGKMYLTYMKDRTAGCYKFSKEVTHEP